MVGGVPYPSTGKRAVILCYYIIFRNTRHLFLLQTKIVRPPPLITESYALLLPLGDIYQGSYPPLLRHGNVKIGRAEMY